MTQTAEPRRRLTRKPPGQRPKRSQRAVVTRLPSTLTLEEKAQIAACRDVYSREAVARHFKVSWHAVAKVWAEKEVWDSAEPPNIWHANTGKTKDLYFDDLVILMCRGMSVQEAAQELGLGVETAYRWLRSEKPELIRGRW